MNSTTYSQKLQNPKWQKRRLEILSRDKFTCQLCGDKETQLHIHHKYYTTGKEAWEYPDNALITYCKHCHSAIEQLNKDWTPLLCAKFNPAGLQKVISLFVVHQYNGSVALSLFDNIQSENTILYKASISVSSVSRMNELLDMAKKLI